MLVASGAEDPGAVATKGNRLPAPRPSDLLARVNAKVDLAERTLLVDALGLPPLEDERKHDGPLEPRSPVYYLPILEAEADRLEAEALKRGLDPDEAGPT